MSDNSSTYFFNVRLNGDSNERWKERQNCIRVICRKDNNVTFTAAKIWNETWSREMNCVPDRVIELPCKHFDVMCFHSSTHLPKTASANTGWVWDGRVALDVVYNLIMLLSFPFYVCTCNDLFGPT